MGRRCRTGIRTRSGLLAGRSGRRAATSTRSRPVRLRSRDHTSCRCAAPRARAIDEQRTTVLRSPRPGERASRPILRSDRPRSALRNPKRARWLTCVGSLATRKELIHAFEHRTASLGDVFLRRFRLFSRSSLLKIETWARAIDPRLRPRRLAWKTFRENRTARRGSFISRPRTLVAATSNSRA